MEWRCLEWSGPFKNITPQFASLYDRFVKKNICNGFYCKASFRLLEYSTQPKLKAFKTLFSSSNTGNPLWSGSAETRAGYIKKRYR
jgi:hypothetical protein